MFNERRHYYDYTDPLANLTEMQRRVYEVRAAAYQGRHPWSNALAMLWRNCLLHLSANVPGKVAYFASIETMLADKPTRTSPEMFRDRWLATAPDEVKCAFDTEILGKTLPEVKFIPNTDADGWERIYAEGPHSCMAGSDLVRQYAHPDNHLALAYLESSDGKITSRTIVNQNTKAWIRVYGSNGAVFATALKRLGYHADEGDSLQGELIHVTYQTCSRCDDEIAIGPYLDGDERTVRGSNDGKGTGIIDRDGDWYLRHAEEEDGGYACNDCSDL